MLDINKQLSFQPYFHSKINLKCNVGQYLTLKVNFDLVVSKLSLGLKYFRIFFDMFYESYRVFQPWDNIKFCYFIVIDNNVICSQLNF